VVVRLGELCEAVSTGGELVLIASPVGVSALTTFCEFCEAVSTGGELVASSVGVSALTTLCEFCEAVSTGSQLVASSVGVSAVARLGELCEAVSTGSELVVIAFPVAGVGDVATDKLFAWFVMLRITKASNTPVNRAIVPQENFFTREACFGSGGGIVLGCGGAPHEGQAVANELISLPQS
jgi:hypothetical protein